MEFDTIRPIISGLIGAAIAGWLAVKWARLLPHATNKGTQRDLLDQQRFVLRCANTGAGLGIAIGLVLYFCGIVDDNDWRGAGVAAGLMALLPILIIVVGNLRGGLRSIKDGFAAYAISQKSPPVLLFLLMALMIAGGIWAGIALLPNTSTAE